MKRKERKVVAKYMHAELEALRKVAEEAQIPVVGLILVSAMATLEKVSIAE